MAYAAFLRGEEQLAKERLKSLASGPLAGKAQALGRRISLLNP